MNNHTSTELKILVERVVRPVRAGVICKQKMRQELLAHVIATFQEEAAKLGDERAALEQTAVRFGNPNELTVRLQECVGGTDRIRRFVDQVWFRTGESWFRRALRQALLIEAMFLLSLFMLWLMSREPMATWTTGGFRRIAAELVGGFLVVLSFTSLGQWMWRALFGSKGRCWRDILLISAICALGAVAFCFAADFMGNGWVGVNRVNDLVVAAWSVLWVLAGMVSMSVARLRYDDAWERLQIV